MSFLGWLTAYEMGKNKGEIAVTVLKFDQRNKYLCDTHTKILLLHAGIHLSVYMDNMHMYICMPMGCTCTVQRIPTFFFDLFVFSEGS